MVFTALIYDSLNGITPTYKEENCFANPFKKKKTAISTNGIVFSKDVLILLTYYKLLDNLQDEKFYKKLPYYFLYPYAKIKAKKAAKQLPELDKLFLEQTKIQSKLEKESLSIDLLCQPTALMTQGIVQNCYYKNNNNLNQFGYFLGRFIYLLDALKDREEDLEDGKFNIFNKLDYSKEDAQKECFTALGELAYWYNALPLKNNIALIDNIIYLSLPRSVKFDGMTAGEHLNEQL